MNIVRVTAATTEEALRQAIERLRVPREALQYRVDRSEEEYLLDDKRPRETTIVAWVKPDYIAEIVRDYLQKLMYYMGYIAEVRVQPEEDRIVAKLASPASSVLIGKNGQTLDAIQYMATRVACKGGRVAPSVVVDIEDYKERKISRLERLARRTAQKVVAEGHEVALPPMSAADRKIVHTALKDFKGVKTYSEGREGQRCVIVAPASHVEETEPEL
ncbi:MAG: KH domain-containing protein [Candidatus Sumerlaeia bacterium]|nr:KH domain-containing protein [Candidatus Sumerlaeia bacterium]